MTTLRCFLSEAPIASDRGRRGHGGQPPCGLAARCAITTGPSGIHHAVPGNLGALLRLFSACLKVWTVRLRRVTSYIEGDTMLGWKATHAFLRPSRFPQYWLVGRQVKCHPAGSQPCCGRRGCGSWHICPIPSPRSCLQKWRTCSRTTSYQRNGIVANGKSSLAYPRGPCLSEHTLQHMDSCLACNTLQMLDFAIVSFRGGLVLLSLCVVSLANSLCVCLRTCFTILLSYLVFRLIAL